MPALCLAAAAAAAQPDAPAHYRASCIECHARMVGGDGGLLYTRAERLAKNYAALQRRTAYCSEQLKLHWNEMQIRETVDYLNERYYRYPRPDHPGRPD